MASSRRRGGKVIADISIYPIGAGTGLGEYVRSGLKAMKRGGRVRLLPGAMSTVLEADRLEDILDAVGRAHAALVRMNAKRIAIHLRVDHRLDKRETIEYKVGRVASAA